MGEFKWGEYINDTVIINLKEREDRRELLDPKMERIKLDNGKTLKDYARYFDAVDKTMIYDFPEGIVEREYSFDYHFIVDARRSIEHLYGQGIMLESTDTEMAICYSHYSIWKDIVENKTPVTLVMEDDVLFRYPFLERLERVMTETLPQDCDLLYLSYDPTVSRNYEEYDDILYTVHFGVWWLSGYIITYEGAKKLLENLPIMAPVDVWINHQFKDLGVYAFGEPLIAQSYETYSSNDWSFTNEFYNK